MLDKLSSKAFQIALIALFLTVVISMVFGFIQQNNLQKDTDKARESIQLVTKDGKTVLTDELLQSDYKVYSRNQSTGLSILKSCIFGFMAMSIIMLANSIYQLVMAKINGKTGIKMVAAVWSVIGMTLFVAVTIFLAVFGSRFLNREKKKITKEQHLYVEACQVVKKDKETVSSGSGDNSSTTTYYYIYLDDGTRLSVSLLVYNQVTHTGSYFIGESENNAIFAMYDSAIYCEE